MVTVDFVKASELPSFSKTLNFESGAGVALALVGALNVGVMAEAISSKRMEKLCVTTPDGRIFALSLESARTPTVRKLDAIRRDAIVLALRSIGDNPFLAVDGPCGVSGKLDWPAELRARVMDFLVRIPAIAPSATASDLIENEVLATALRKSWTTENHEAFGESGAMLLVSGVWRGVSIAERPRFLTAEDFDRFSASKVTVEPNGIVALLPTYASGSYDPNGVSVQSFCLISRDGRAIAVAGPTYLDGPNVQPRKGGWKSAAASVVRSGSGEPDRESRCLPSDTRNWSDADRAAALEFLETIRAPD